VNMTEDSLLMFTIESFYKLVGKKRLMAAKCEKCGALLLPPRPLCSKCFSKDLRWVELGKKGKLVSYTVIHVPSKQFQAMAPYVVGIVKLEDCLCLPGMIRGVKPEEIKISMGLEVDFDTTLQFKWPIWPRYYFKPI